MIARWLSNIKWALLIAIVAGPGFAVWSFMQVQTFQRIGAEGTEATAIIDGGESRSGRRSGTSYKLHAVWDAGGTERAENISISSEYAGKVIDGDFITIETAQIKYLPEEPEVAAVMVEDLPQQIADAQLMIWLGIGAGVVGAIGSAIFFLVGRKKKEAPAAQEPSKSTSGLGF